MKYLWMIFIFITFSCKRKNTYVKVYAIDNDTEFRVPNIKLEVVRKGKKSWLQDKEHLLVSEGYTNENGEATLNFKYDRGNKYALYAYSSDQYFATSSDLYDDLFKGKNETTLYLHQYCYLKLNLKSTSPEGKILNVKIDNFNTVHYQYFYGHINPIDTTVFKKSESLMGNKSITWEVDSAGTIKNYSLPVQLKGHDTTYVTLTF